MATQKWTCEYCGTAKDTEEQAGECEKSHGPFFGKTDSYGATIELFHPNLGALIIKAEHLANAVSAGAFTLHKPRGG